MPHFDYLIIGDGLAVTAAIDGLREIDAHGSVGVLTPTPAENGLTGRANVDVRRGRTATRLDPARHEARDDQGETYAYGRLLLALPGRPRRLDVGGDEIFYYTTGDGVREFANRGERLAVIGAGLAGVELAANLRQQGKQVLLIGDGEAVAADVLPVEAARYLTDYLREQGVDFMPGWQVAGLERRGPQTGLRLRQAASGAEREAVVDGVAAALGTTPDTALAEAAGLQVEDGIVVDDTFRTSQPDIYAAGESAAYYSRLLARWVRPAGPHAVQAAARHAGRCMAGATEPYDELPYLRAEVFDLALEGVGDTRRRLETVTYWRVPAQTGVVYYLHGGRVRGVLMWNVAGYAEEARCLIGERGPFEPVDMKDQLPWRKAKATAEAATLFKQQDGNDF